MSIREWWQNLLEYLPRHSRYSSPLDPAEEIIIAARERLLQRAQLERDMILPPRPPPSGLRPAFRPVQEPVLEAVPIPIPILEIPGLLRIPKTYDPCWTYLNPELIVHYQPFVDNIRLEERHRITFRYGDGSESYLTTMGPEEFKEAFVRAMRERKDLENLQRI